MGCKYQEVGVTGITCHKYYLANTELSILPAWFYLILTVTLRELLLISSSADVEIGTEWLDNLLEAIQVTVRGEKKRVQFCRHTQVYVFLILILSPLITS